MKNKSAAFFWAKYVTVSGWTYNKVFVNLSIKAVFDISKRGFRTKQARRESLFDKIRDKKRRFIGENCYSDEGKFV